MRVINQPLAFFHLTVHILFLFHRILFIYNSHIIFNPIQKASEADFLE